MCYGLCLCVYHNSFFFQNSRAGQLALGVEAFYNLSYTAFRKFGYLQNNVTFFLNFVPNSTLKMARQLLQVLYNTRIYFNMCWKTHISYLNLSHGKKCYHLSATSLSYWSFTFVNNRDVNKTRESRVSSLDLFSPFWERNFSTSENRD